MLWKKHGYREVSKGIKSLFPRLWRYCLLLTGSRHHADDLAQSTCLRALDKSDQFSVGTDLDRWLFRIAKNIWFNELRAQAVRFGGGLQAIEDIDLEADNRSKPESSIMNKEVLNSIFSLPEAQRIVVALVYIEGYSYKDSADILDIPVGTVMSRLSAARTKLAKQLEHYPSDVV